VVVACGCCVGDVVVGGAAAANVKAKEMAEAPLPSETTIA